MVNRTKPLLATTMLLASTVIAGAVENRMAYYVDDMPTAHRSAWCSTSTPNVMRKCGRATDENSFVITAERINTAESACEATHITKAHPKADTKHLWVRSQCVYREDLEEANGDHLSIQGEGRPVDALRRDADQQRRKNSPYQEVGLVPMRPIPPHCGTCARRGD
jgi:hypothetical protein